MRIKLHSLSLILLMYASQSNACRLTTPNGINLATSIDEEKSFSYASNQVRNEMPRILVNQCQGSASQKKYLMIAFGPEVVELSDQQKGFNFNRSYVKSKCLIEHNPLKQMTSEEDKQHEFEQKWAYINKCIDINVRETGANDLFYPEDQEGCSVKKISNKIASFRGGYCFFKPTSNSQLEVSLSINPACEKLAEWKNLSLDMRDIRAELSFYLSSFYKGDLVDLDALSALDVRHSTNPVKDLIAPTDDFGQSQPLFPAKYVLSDLHLGKIEFNQVLKDYIKIKTPFIVDHHCEQVSKEGLRSSLCNYDIPLSAEITLKDEQGEELLHWYDGGIAPVQWQGIINGRGQMIPASQIKANNNYVLEISFSDPYFNFASLKKDLLSKILKIPGLEFSRNSDGSINEIFVLPDLGKIQDANTIEITSSDSSMDIVRKRLNSFFSNTFFPPFYDQVCDGAGTHCQKTDGEFAKFQVSFKLDQNLVPIVHSVTRSSNILGNYKKYNITQPEFRCH